MHKSTKTLLILAGVLTVCGLLIVLLAAALAGFDYKKLSTDQDIAEQTYSFNSAEIRALEIESGPADVQIIGSDTDAGIIQYEECRGVYYDIAFDEAGTLSIRYRNERKWYQMIGVMSRPYEITIYLPPEIAAKIQINGGSGKASLSGLSALRELSVRNQSGAVETDQVACGGNLAVTTASGNITMRNTAVLGAVSLQANSGDVRCNAVEAAGLFAIDTKSGAIRTEDSSSGGDMQMRAESGNIRLMNIQAGGELSLFASSGGLCITDSAVQHNVSLATKSGDIDFDRLSGRDFEIEAESGAVKGSVKGTAEDYIVSAKSSSGTVRVPDTGRGDNLIRITTASGNITLSFI